MKTIHLVFHAHLDPVWLWPLTAGIDECIATCRSACDRLDAHPGLRYSQGEAWVYQQVERIDPDLFARIRKHIESGRWEVTGGWWVQADCNAPSGWGLEKQIELGKEYFLSRFGQFPAVGFNPDTFGHTAALPGIMRAAGQSAYVMMRPQEHEKELPARLFRWRGYDNGPEVTTFRIAGGYCCPHAGAQRHHIENSLKNLPDGIDDTMCFLGVGDHGGGPTEGLIHWLEENWNTFDGARLKYSTMADYFALVAKQVDKLPLVTGELQMHAVGCYSVHRPVKLGVRKAEHLLKQAEMNLATGSPERQKLQEAWQAVCLHSFHDTMGGTCLPSAYGQVGEQLGMACSVADESLVYGLRRKMTQLPPDPCQRMVLFNASDTPFDGYVEVEPFVDWWQPWRATHKVMDAKDVEVPHQIIKSEAMCAFGNDGHPYRVLLRRQIAPKAMDVLRIVREGNPSAVSPLVNVSESGELTSSSGTSAKALPEISLHLIDDPTDTWSHDTDRYGETPLASATWNAHGMILDRGPLMASFARRGTIGQSGLMAEWRVYGHERFVELLLEVDWRELRKVLKLTVTLPGTAQIRTDGVSGGALVRENNGKEVPLRDWTLLGTGPTCLGVLCPDVFACDATPQRLRLTLLRSTYMAHHVPLIADPASPDFARAVISDHGRNRFRFRFFTADTTATELELQAMMLQRPPLFADYTKGMPSDARLAL